MGQIILGSIEFVLDTLQAVLMILILQMPVYVGSILNVKLVLVKPSICNLLAVYMLLRLVWNRTANTLRGYHGGIVNFASTNFAFNTKGPEIPAVHDLNPLVWSHTTALLLLALSNDSPRSTGPADRADNAVSSQSLRKSFGHLPTFRARYISTRCAENISKKSKVQLV